MKAAAPRRQAPMAAVAPMVVAAPTDCQSKTTPFTLLAPSLLAEVHVVITRVYSAEVS